MRCKTPAFARSPTPSGCAKPRVLAFIHAAAALLFCLSAMADPATENFAPGQLDMAQAQLSRARDALSLEDYELARRLAFQAQLDARLAWKMTESADLRRRAAVVAREAEALRVESVISAAAIPR
jgi:hypothetical protein